MTAPYTDAELAEAREECRAPYYSLRDRSNFHAFARTALPRALDELERLKGLEQRQAKGIIAWCDAYMDTMDRLELEAAKNTEVAKLVLLSESLVRQADDDFETMAGHIAELEAVLKGFDHAGHSESCSVAPELNIRNPKCTCGADAHNDKLDVLLKQAHPGWAGGGL